MKGRLILLALGAVLLSGCGSAVHVGPLLKEYDAYERDAAKLAGAPRASSASPAASDQRIASTLPVPLFTGFLASARAQRAEAEPLVSKGKNAAALPLLEKAVADARLALAAALADQAREQALASRADLSKTRRLHEDALIVLRETEKAAKASPHEIPGEPPETETGPNTTLPPTLLAGTAPPALGLDAIRSAWNAISDAASARGVPIPGPAARFEFHEEAAAAPKTKDADRATHLYVATRAVQEAEATLRARLDMSVCLDAGRRTAGLFDAHDLALRSTIEMERDMRDALRAEARDRQSELYDALHQLEGKYAHIQKTARGTILSLADILFDFDKATLKRDVEFNLVKVATILNQFSEMKIAVEGHTDNIGTPEYNLDLSQRRAQAVHDFLVSQDVSADRMTVAGFGLTHPVADNATDEGRQKNRRVDLVIQDR